MAGARNQPKTTDAPTGVVLSDVIRDRIVEFRRVPNDELRDNERNWRTHPYEQRVALKESLQAVGIADVMIAYYSERNGGALTLIDGHLRREDNENIDWPTIITDLNDAEADLMLATLDPMTGLATADGDLLLELLSDVHTGTPAIEDMLRALASEARPAEELIEEAAILNEGGPREMELQPMEHYDYVIFMFRNALDWQQAKEFLDIEQEGFTLRDGITRRVGLGRVLDGRRLTDLLTRDAEHKAADKAKANKPAAK